MKEKTDNKKNIEVIFEYEAKDDSDARIKQAFDILIEGEEEILSIDAFLGKNLL